MGVFAGASLGEMTPGMGCVARVDSDGIAMHAARWLPRKFPLRDATRIAHHDLISG
jgi:hypothetical protein